MGFRDHFRSLHKSEEAPASEDRSDQVKASLQEERQAFLDSLKVDASDAPQASTETNAGRSAPTGDDGGRERGDDLTQTRCDDLKTGPAGQEVQTDANEQDGDAAVNSGEAAPDGDASAASDSGTDDGNTDDDGLSL